MRTLSRTSYMPRYVPTNYRVMSDSGIDTDEELNNSDSDITCDADATTAIPAGSLIKVESELMWVTATGATLTVSRIDPVVHTTNQDIYVYKVSNCVLWLPGQDDPQSATIRDRSGNGNNGTITDATWIRQSSGLWALSFDGTGNVVKTGVVSVPSAFTALTWWKRSGASGGSSASDYHTIFTALNGRNDYNGFLVASDGTSCRGDINTSLGNYNSTTVTIAATGWHLIGYMWTGSNLYTLTDGNVSAATVTTGTLNSGTTGMRMGRWLDNNNYYLANGLIALPRVLNAAITATQFAGIFRQERSLLGV